MTTTMTRAAGAIARWILVAHLGLGCVVEPNLTPAADAGDPATPDQDDAGAVDGGKGGEDSGPVDPGEICLAGRTATRPCGLNQRGLQRRTCILEQDRDEEGRWSEWSACSDPDVCVDDATDAGGEVCGLNGRGTGDRVCISGAWELPGTCSNDPDVCVDNTADTGGEVCGFNGRGTGDRVCVSGAWASPGTCSNDPDVCVDNTTDTGGGVCGFNGRGTGDRACVSGAWASLGTCTNDPDVCVDDATDTSGGVCGLNGRGTGDRACVSGAWESQGTCSNDPDVCVDDTIDAGGGACGLNGRGTGDRVCVSGAWASLGTCTNDPDVCVDDTTDTGGGVCGLNGRGTGDRACVSGAWESQGTCSNDPDVCVDGASDALPCGLNGRGARDRACVSGAWEDRGVCRDDPDVCVDGASDVGGEACGFNGGGTGDRVCVTGAWQAQGTCSNDPDDCVDGATDAGGEPCGLNGRGAEDRACVSGAWQSLGTCSSEPDVCVDGAVERGGSCADCREGQWVEVPCPCAAGDLSSPCNGCPADTVVPPGFVCAPAGSFLQGEGDPSGAEPRQVTLTRAFFVQATEVTQGEWRSLMGSNPAWFQSCGESCPVEKVSWFSALSFANAKSEAEGLTPCYGASGGSLAGGATPYECEGYRLPTEAEWGYAYRAGTQTAFSWGDDAAEAADHAWYSANAGSRTRPVGTKLANAWGLHDMAGNVYEWVHDAFASPPAGAAIDPWGPPAAPERVIRGGAWFDPVSSLAEWTRGYSAPNGRQTWLGFRLVRTVTELATTRECTLENGTGIRTLTGSAYGACTAQSCNSGYHVEGAMCASDTRSCTVANGTGTQSYAGGAWGACSLESCNNGYHEEGGACVSNTRTCIVTNGTGNETWEGSAWGSCTVTGCNADYHVESNACAPDTKSCTIDNGSGTQTWEGSAYGACSLVSCNSGYHDGGNGTCVTTDTCASGYELNGDGACVSSAGGYLTGPVNMQFAVIPKDTFTMGSPAGELGRDSDETQHEVTFTYDFAMGVTEVTQGQWKAKSGGTNPSNFSSCGDNCPVEQVDWYSTLAYANALSRDAGLQECYTLTPATCADDVSDWGGGDTSCSGATFVGLSCTGYRLPTEAEWEYAYRAGTTTAYYNGVNTQTERSPLDANLDAIGWYGGNSGVSYSGGFGCSGWYDGSTTCGTHAVGERTPNAWGLYDMSGNVWEWTWDRYGTYPGAISDYIGPQTGFYRVLRGGSWNSVADYARAAVRFSSGPGGRNSRSGFRLTRTLP